MHITREKRPDRVICKWKDIQVELYRKQLVISEHSELNCNFVWLDKSEIPNLIKALQEVSK